MALSQWFELIQVQNQSKVNRNKAGRAQVIEYSETALPTCYWIFYYYGDFSVAPSFAHTVNEREKRETEREQKESRLSQAKKGVTI